MNRKQAQQAERAALEAMKVAAVDLVAAKTGGYSTTRIGETDTPLMARARYIAAGEAWVAASHALVDAILLETSTRPVTQEDRLDVDRAIPRLALVTEEK